MKKESGNGQNRAPSASARSSELIGLLLWLHNGQFLYFHQNNTHWHDKWQHTLLHIIAFKHHTPFQPRLDPLLERRQKTDRRFLSQTDETTDLSSVGRLRRSIHLENKFSDIGRPFPYDKLSSNDLALGAGARFWPLPGGAPQVREVSWENDDSLQQKVARDMWSSPLDRKKIGAWNDT